MSPPATLPSAQDKDLEAHRVNIFLHAENVRVFQKPQDRQLPVTIVSGALGAGKTTLLRHILTNKSNLRVAAAINDFAELNIDENLIRHNASGKASRVVELSNGCVCCHLLDDLQAAVWKMLGGGGNNSGNGTSDWELDAINYLVIETSGVSDPARIIRSLDAKFGKCYRARLDSVVTVVDADVMLQSIIDEKKMKSSTAGLTMSPTTRAQLECADVIVLNKMDLLENPDDDGQALLENLRAINESAVVHQTNHCKIPLSAILDVHIPTTTNSEASPITHEASQVPIYVSTTGGALRSSASLDVSTRPKTPADGTHLKADDYISISETISDQPLSLSKLQQFVTSSAVQRLARMKGVVWIHDDGGTLKHFRCILHLSGRGRLGFQIDGRWTGPPTSEMAFIGRSTDLDPASLALDFRNCRVRSNEESNDDIDALGADMGVEFFRSNPEFVQLQVADNDNNISSSNSLAFFRLTGAGIYGYTEEEIERELRVDTDAMNRDLVDAVNATVDKPKAFLAYTWASIDDTGRTRVVLCYTGKCEPANNSQVLLREAKAVLSTHFRNVQVCKCGF